MYNQSKGVKRLKFIKKQIEGLNEVEVELRYAEMNNDIIKLIKSIENNEKFIYGTDEGRQYKIRVSEIYYAESVDKKTFLYTKSSVFRTELRLYQLIETLKANDFIQISKSCIVNMDVLESIRALSNSCLEATLINGEKVNVSRKYLTDIKTAFVAKEEEA